MSWSPKQNSSYGLYLCLELFVFLFLLFKCKPLIISMLSPLSCYDLHLLLYLKCATYLMITWWTRLALRVSSIHQNQTRAFTKSSLWAVVGDSPRRSVKKLTRREHLILAQIKGDYTLARVLQWGLVGSGDSLIPRQNITAFPLLSIYFEHLLWTIQFLFLHSKNCHARVGLELRVLNFYAVDH